MNIYYNAKRKNTPGVIKAKTYGYEPMLWMFVLKILIKGGWPYKESLVGFEQDVKW
jgi:hypothetical protein